MATAIVPTSLRRPKTSAAERSCWRKLWRSCLGAIDGSRRHQSNFSPNWICRDVVEVEVMTPAVGDGPPVAAAETTGFGVFRLVGLKRLKTSERNLKVRRSVNAEFFVTDSSPSTSFWPPWVFPTAL